MNLIMFHFITKKLSFNPSRSFSKLVKSNYTKIAVLGLLILVFFPGFTILEDRKELVDDRIQDRPGSYIDTIPGGNEKKLQFWLYENTEPGDLVLNDLSNAAKWYIGFKAQKMINGFNQDIIAWKYVQGHPANFEKNFPGVFTTMRANEILKDPWDHEKIDEIINELDIKYIYLSERERSEYRCFKHWEEPIQCYQTSQTWPWQNYSGNARIAMYENHPSLELVLRNGDSAIFRVV